MDQTDFIGRMDGAGGAVVVAEVGVNHDGDIATAHELVDTAAERGADVVKFQTFIPDLLTSATAEMAEYQRRSGAGGGQRELISSLALPEGAWRELVHHCREVGVGFASTAFDPPSLELIVGLGVPFLKVPSGEVTNLPFVRELAAVGAPLVISTGMSTLAEVDSVIAAAAGARHVSLLHCVSSYPAPPEDANLRALVTMRDHFGVPTGWSDHTVGQESATLAVALGARLLEKHITLDRTRIGPDHAASADPSMFHDYVTSIRRAEAMLGDGVKQPRDAERDVMRVARRAWHARRDLQPGTELRSDDLVALRPAVGVPPTEDLTGRRIGTDIAAGAPIRWDDLA